MNKKIKLAIAKGRLFQDVLSILSDAGFKVYDDGRNYRPRIDDPDIEVKILKPQNIPRLVEIGSQDIAFTGHDWVIEEKANVEELLDLKLNPVKIIAAIPDSKSIDELKNKKIRVASEYEIISKDFLENEGFDYIFIKSFGTTEAFIPEDADMIIDNMSTGKTLKENHLKVYNEILFSSTRLIANKDAMVDTWKKKKISYFLMLLQGALDARKKLLVEMNVSNDKFENLVKQLPFMRAPTVSKLHNDQGYALKTVVEKSKINHYLPLFIENGATDILIFNLLNIINNS